MPVRDISRRLILFATGTTALNYFYAKYFKFGWNLLAVYFYMVVELGFPQRPVATFVERMFNVHISSGTGAGLKTRVCNYYMETHLILLSICQTYFLDFLRSGETDVEAFAQSRRRRRTRSKTVTDAHEPGARDAPNALAINSANRQN